MTERSDYIRGLRTRKEVARRLYLRERPQRFAEMPFGVLWNGLTSQPVNPQSCLNQEQWVPFARGEANPEYERVDGRIRHPGPEPEPEPERTMTATA